MSNIGPASLWLGASLAGGALAWAAIGDLRRFVIPNRIPLLAAAGYLAAAPGLGVATWTAGLAVGLLALGLGAWLFAREWVGGGDVKLAAAAALWAGPAHLSAFVGVTAAAGLALGLFMLTPARRLMPQPAWASAAEPQTGLRQPMPFGVALAAGGAWVIALRLTPLA